MPTQVPQSPVPAHVGQRFWTLMAIASSSLKNGILPVPSQSLHLPVPRSGSTEGPWQSSHRLVGLTVLPRGSSAFLRARGYRGSEGRQDPLPYRSGAHETSPPRDPWPNADRSCTRLHAAAEAESRVAVPPQFP